MIFGIVFGSSGRHKKIAKYGHWSGGDWMQIWQQYSFLLVAPKISKV